LKTDFIGTFGRDGAVFQMELRPETPKEKVGEVKFTEDSELGLRGLRKYD
jgi:hypothetical protein